MKHFQHFGSNTYRKCDCRRSKNREEMHIVALFLKSDRAIAETKQNETNDFLCISLEWLKNAVFGKEITVGLYLTKKMHFRVSRTIRFNRVVGVHRNDPDQEA